MRKSSPRSCSLDGTYAKVEVMYELEFGGPSTRTQTNEIKHNCSSFRRTFRRMMPYTGCIEEENIEEEEAEGAGCCRIEVPGF